MKTIDFNLNDYFLVKLNDLGYEELLRQHNEAIKNMPFIEKRDISYFKNKADENGYTEFQAWDFINKFGNKTTMGMHQMFDINIKIQVNE